MPSGPSRHSGRPTRLAETSKTPTFYPPLLTAADARGFFEHYRVPGASEAPALSHLSSPRTPSFAYLPLYMSTSPAVIWGGFGSKGCRCSCMNSPALMVDCSSASLCSKTLVVTITPAPGRPNGKRRIPAFR